MDDMEEISEENENQGHSEGDDWNIDSQRGLSESFQSADLSEEEK